MTFCNGPVNRFSKALPGSLNSLPFHPLWCYIIASTIIEWPKKNKQTINDNKIWTMELHRWIKGVTQLLTLQLKFSLKSRRFCLPRFFVEGFNSATLLLNAKNQQLLNSRIVLHALATAQAQLNLFWYRSISWSISGKIKRYLKTGLYFHTCITSLYWVFLRECGAFFLWQATNQYG